MNEPTNEPTNELGWFPVWRGPMATMTVVFNRN